MHYPYIVDGLQPERQVGEGGSVCYVKDHRYTLTKKHSYVNNHSSTRKKKNMAMTKITAVS